MRSASSVLYVLHFHDSFKVAPSLLSDGSIGKSSRRAGESTRRKGVTLRVHLALPPLAALPLEFHKPTKDPVDTTSLQHVTGGWEYGLTQHLASHDCVDTMASLKAVDSYQLLVRVRGLQGSQESPTVACLRALTAWLQSQALVP
jgi:hypothetical protein